MMQEFLAIRTATLNLTNMTLSDAIDYVHVIGGGPPFEVDWKALEAAGMDGTASAMSKLLV